MLDADEPNSPGCGGIFLASKAPALPASWQSASAKHRARTSSSNSRRLPAHGADGRRRSRNGEAVLRGRHRDDRRARRHRHHRHRSHALSDGDATWRCPDRPDQRRDRQRLYAHQGDRTARRGRSLGSALHRSREQDLQGVPGTAERFAEPIWPALSHAKIFRLAFRDKGRLVDSPEHPLFKKWAARDRG